MARDASDVPPSCVARVQDALACVVERNEPRRARRDGACIVVERGGRRAFPYLRFHRLADDTWRLEELGGRGPTLVWVMRRRAKTLDDLLRRWLDPALLHSDIRVTAPDGGAALAKLFATPPSRRRQVKVPTSIEPSKEQRRAMRRELEGALEAHRPWLVKELAKLSHFRPEVKLRRVQLEWTPGSLHDGLWWSATATDAGGDEATEHAPSIRSRNLWPRAIRSRIAGNEPGWFQAAAECLEAWILETWRLAAPTPPCPVYLSVHDGLDRGVNVATGQRTTFRRG
jgi:hypothetical protein